MEHRLAFHCLFQDVLFGDHLTKTEVSIQVCDLEGLFDFFEPQLQECEFYIYSNDDANIKAALNSEGSIVFAMENINQSSHPLCFLVLV